MKIAINREVVTDRMNALGLSERTLVQRTQIPYMQFRKARIAGYFDDHTTLAQVQRLATELGTSLATLFTARTDEASEPPTQASTYEDAETLIPVLISVPAAVALAHAARVLGWSRDRMDNALALVPGRLEGTGMRLHHVNGRAKILAIESPHKTVTHAIGRLQTMTSGLNLNQAHTLRSLINGERVFQQNTSQKAKLTLGALKNMGCIELDDKAQYRITADMRLVLPDIE